VGLISNAYTLGPRTCILSSAKLTPLSRNWLRDYSQVRRK
jgi:hypothetical protein